MYLTSSFIIIFSTSTPMFSSLPNYIACIQMSALGPASEEIEMIGFIHFFLIDQLTLYTKPDLSDSRDHIYFTM